MLFIGIGSVVLEEKNWNCKKLTDGKTDNRRSSLEPQFGSRVLTMAA